MNKNEHRPHFDAPISGHWSTDEGTEMANRYLQLSREELAYGQRADLELANAIYMVGRGDLELIGLQTAAKERIRWLSAQLAAATTELQSLRSAREVEPVIQPWETRPQGEDAMEPDEVNVFEGSWAVVMGTNAKPAGWVDTHALFAGMTYRDQLLHPSPSTEPMDPDRALKDALFAVHKSGKTFAEYGGVLVDDRGGKAWITYEVRHPSTEGLGVRVSAAYTHWHAAFSKAFITTVSKGGEMGQPSTDRYIKVAFKTLDDLHDAYSAMMELADPLIKEALDRPALSALSTSAEEVEPLRDAFRNADESDWKHLFGVLPDTHRGRFWKAVMTEAKAALSQPNRVKG